MASINAAPPVQRARYFTLSAFWFGSSFHWLLLLLILMPADVVRFMGETQKGTYLGLILGVGAVIALVMPPLVGAYSDRVGKRLVFIRWGVLLNVLGLAGMAFAPGYWPYFAAFLLVQFGNNLATAPYSALIPELVPSAERGKASGIMGFLQAGGQLLGGVTAFAFGLLAVPGGASYAAVALVLLASAFVTLRGVPEPQRVTPELPADRTPPARTPWNRILQGAALTLAFLFAVRLSAGVHPLFALGVAGAGVLALVAWLIRQDRRGRLLTKSSVTASVAWWQLFMFQAFLWVFVTRVLFSFGQYSIQPFLQYYVGDVLGRARDAATVTSVMLLCIIVGSIVSALIGGRISDRLGRKPVIYVAGGVMASCAILFLFAPNLVVALVLALVFGLGYGAFISVDWALGSDAMPSARSYARDMGVWHVAFVAPQMSSAPQGALLDWGNAQGEHLGYTLVFGIAAACFLLGVLLIRNIRDVH